MATEHPFNATEVALNTPQAKTLLKSFDRVNEDLRALAFKYPNAPQGSGGLAYKLLTEVSADIDLAGRDLAGVYERRSAEVRERDLTPLTYDPKNIVKREVKIYSPLANHFLKIIKIVDLIVPLVETLAFAEVLTIRERNQELRRLKKQVIELGGRITQARSTIEAALQKKVETNKRHRTIRPATSQRVAGIRMANLPEPEGRS